MKLRLLILLLAGFNLVRAQSSTGIISGNVLNDQKKPLVGATVVLYNLKDSSGAEILRTDNEGVFTFSNLSYGHRRVVISFVGHNSITIDSIYIRAERSQFNLADITLAANSASNMNEVIVYAERPLVQSKDGNITFNAAESPLAAGSNASDLLTSVPLISKDPNGKLLVRGREPKILIDDKPVELNLQQLQDLLESMPGSAIEKIEVLTNPPPQYANETGGVINIVTKKGRVGRSGRLSIFAGSRGEQGMNGSFNYRKQGLVIGVNAGAAHNNFSGYSYSRRDNIYADSVNHFNTNSNYRNTSLRPNLRATIDYDLNKNHAINLVLQFNQGQSKNNSESEYRNINRNDSLYRYSKRYNKAATDYISPNIDFNYTFRTKKAGEVLRLFSSVNFSDNDNDRNFLQEFYTPNLVFVNDSMQFQNTANRTHGFNTRFSYDAPVDAKRKTFISAGSYFNSSNSRIVVDASAKRKTDDAIIPSEALSNDFYFHQYIWNTRASVKHIFGPGFSISTGLAAERTTVNFELFKSGTESTNSYWSLLPFLNFNKNWEEKLNLTTSYRRSIRRPGINEQNPSIDNSDPYNVRFGNPDLMPSMVHNVDVVLGKTKKTFYTNVGLGYNRVENIFSQLRTPVSDSKTEITFKNISDKNEYEISTWSGYTLWNKWRMNLSASYTYNQYLQKDKTTPVRFNNGSSFSSNFNTNYTWKERYTVTGNLTYNQFANPQGSVRSNVSMNVGAQVKMLQKKLTLTLNLIDPFNQQENRTFTYGQTFKQENFSLTNTRNYRVSVGYNFIKSPPKKSNKQLLKDALKNNKT